MKNVEVREVRSIVIDINMSPSEWDPRRFNTDPSTTIWHKAKLLNQRVAKYAPGMGQKEFYTNLARFADEIGYGDSDVIIKLVEYLYNSPLEF